VEEMSRGNVLDPVKSQRSSFIGIDRSKIEILQLNFRQPRSQIMVDRSKLKDTSLRFRPCEALCTK